jgi:hypothetical protein
MITAFSPYAYTRSQVYVTFKRYKFNFKSIQNFVLKTSSKNVNFSFSLFKFKFENFAIKYSNVLFYSVV